MKSNSQIRKIAKENLTGNYVPATINAAIIGGISLAYQIILNIESFRISYYNTGGFVLFTMVGAIIISLVQYMIEAGNLWGYLDIHDGERMTVNHLWEGFKNQPGKLARLGITKFFLLLFWSLLFIIPGVIKGYSYAMSEFLFDDYPDADTREILLRSESIMYGHRFQLFVLDITYDLMYVAIIFISGLLGYAGLFGLGGILSQNLATLNVVNALFGGIIVLFLLVAALSSLFIEPRRWAAYAVFYTELVGMDQEDDIVYEEEEDLFDEEDPYEEFGPYDSE